MPHSVSYLVYYADTDAGGVVYHANYLTFAERARTDMLRDIGISQAQLLADHKAFVVRRIVIDLIRPAYLEDEITVETTVTEIKHTSCVVEQQLSREKTLLALLTSTIVFVDLLKKRPARLPQDVSAFFRMLKL